MRKLRNLNVEKKFTFFFDKTKKKMKLWQNSGTKTGAKLKTVTKLKNLKCHKTQKPKKCPDSETKIVKKKALNSKYDKTQNLT